MNFYTNCLLHGNKILLKGISDGREYLKKVDYRPSLYTLTDNDSEFKTIYGDNLKEKKFDSIRDAKQYISDNKEVSNFKIFGNDDLAQQYLCREFSEVKYDPSKIKISVFDIETTTEHGFPEWQNPIEEILLVTFVDYHTKVITAFGRRPIDRDKFTHIKGEYYFNLIPNEKEFIEKVARHVRSNVDILSGWYIGGFDLPYLFARAKTLLGEEFIHEFSPWGIVNTRVRRSESGQVSEYYDIKGISVLDYIDLYEKYAVKKQENYALDTIANVELGVGKLENPYNSFKDWYENDFTNFTEYNAIDCMRVIELEEKLNMILLVISIAYDAHINFDEVASPVRTWHGILHHYFYENNMAVEVKTSYPEGKSIMGGYVHDIDPIKKDWTITFDATSLYPSIIMGWNISPETLSEGTTDISIESSLADFKPREADVCIALNTHMFSRDKQGVIPKVIERVFVDRQTYKKKMLEAKSKYEETGDAKYKKEATLYDVYQMAKKILANSLYGAMAQRYFMFYDTRLAEAVTSTGQFITQRVRNEMNSYLNKICKTDSYDYVYYCDTDSIFISLEPLVKAKFAGKTTKEIIDLMDKTAEGILRKQLDHICGTIEQNLNAFESRISFKREAIASRAIFTSKKKYAMLVYNNEGVAYDPPTMKITGIEVVRTSTPMKVREFLKDAVLIALSKEEEDIHSYVENVEKQFMELDYKEIAYPTGVNNLGKYTSKSSIYSKGTPIHVRGALLFNHYIRKYKLDKEYEVIKEGNKVKYVYLKTPNKLLEDVVSFQSDIPEEFGVIDKVDYDKMFAKQFIGPLDRLIQPLGWTTKPVSSLEDLFC